MYMCTCTSSSASPLIFPPPPPLPLISLSHLDSLLEVLLLLRLERQIDEQLLQLLIAVVDAELLEPVLLKDLKAIDVQQTHHILADFALCVGKSHTTCGTVRNNPRQYPTNQPLKLNLKLPVATNVLHVQVFLGGHVGGLPMD